MSTSTITILHPGEMGASVASAAASSGNRGLWVTQGRGASIAERARAAGGLESAPSVHEAQRQSDAVILVCPPQAFWDNAERGASSRSTGLYVDVNAISPATARTVGERAALRAEWPTAPSSARRL